MYALYFLVMIFIIKCRKYSTFISSLRKCSFNETQCFQNETFSPFFHETRNCELFQIDVTPSGHYVTI